MRNVWKNDHLWYPECQENVYTEILPDYSNAKLQTIIGRHVTRDGVTHSDR